MFSRLIKTMLLGILLIAGFSNCKKSGGGISKIDPATQPSELSRAFIIPGGVNKNGNAPVETTATDLIISKFQPSAELSADNYLFIPFSLSARENIKGVYLQVDGADNFWEIPVKLEQTSAHVLNIGIPENILNGDFTLFYRLIGVAGGVGKAVPLETSIVSSIDYCANGSSSGAVEGKDGITVKSYSLGEQAGWVSITYDTYSVPDRIDIRYGNEWIRSTGKLLAGNVPPAKLCNAVTSGDGFVGTSSVFNFFYEPKKSKKLDIYVSGCLDGGTAWKFQVNECPKDKPVMGVHSNANPDAAALSGHAWVSITKDGKTDFYGLWPDTHPSIVQLGLSNGNGSDVRTNVEKGVGVYSRYYP
ncbi:MAG: hypothetical protein WCF67_02720, partial [Chitinophagaceae bacterium]